MHSPGANPWSSGRTFSKSSGLVATVATPAMNQQLPETDHNHHRCLISCHDTSSGRVIRGDSNLVTTMLLLVFRFEVKYIALAQSAILPILVYKIKGVQLSASPATKVNQCYRLDDLRTWTVPFVTQLCNYRNATLWQPQLQHVTWSQVTKWSVQLCKIGTVTHSYSPRMALWCKSYRVALATRNLGSLPIVRQISWIKS